MQRAMIWCNPFESGGKVLIEGSVLELISSYCQRQIDSPEAGGILLGYRRGIHLHVVSATPPQLSDRRTRYRFHRTAPFHQHAATALWEQSSGEVDYLGEWHTHPEKKPSPSSLDIREWRKICSDREAPMVFVITGISGLLWLGVGCGSYIIQGGNN